MPRELTFDYGRVELHTPQAPDVDPNGANAVVDGDTLKIGGRLFRLRGWDAPPLTGNCCEAEHEKGRDARDYFEQLMQWGAARGTLTLKVRNVRDRHGRPLVDIRVEGRDIGEIMAEHGLAAPYQGKGPKPVFCTCEAKRRLHEAEVMMADARQQRSFVQRLVRRAAGALGG